MAPIGKKLTATPIANHRIEHSDKIGDDVVNIVETSKHRDDIGAGIGVFLLQDTGQEDRQSLTSTA